VYDQVPVPQTTPLQHLPEQLAHTLDLIIGKLDMLTQTVSMLDERISSTEDKITIILNEPRTTPRDATPSRPQQRSFSFRILKLKRSPSSRTSV
jgi:hypothetical protein